MHVGWPDDFCRPQKLEKEKTMKCKSKWSGKNRCRASGHLTKQSVFHWNGANLADQCPTRKTQKLNKSQRSVEWSHDFFFKILAGCFFWSQKVQTSREKRAPSFLGGFYAEIWHNCHILITAAWNNACRQKSGFYSILAWRLLLALKSVKMETIALQVTVL